MRVGQNPVKAVESIEAPAPVTVVIISYIPFLAGYYAQSLDVLKRCLASIKANTVGDYDLMLFDNGSCAEARAYLLEQEDAGNIDFLFLSERNLGKAGAWNLALAAAPGEVIAYADSDVYFHPGWLEAHLDALDAFPNVGMLTGMPLLSPEKYSSSTVKWAESARGVKFERGQSLSWEDFWRHARSLGDDEEVARKFYSETESIRISKANKQFFAGAAHFQFVSKKDVLQEVLPIPAERPMGRVRLLDEMINEKGYLRLSLPHWYVHHMGNTLSEAEELVAAKGQDSSSIWQWGPMRKLLQRLYDRIFSILYRQ
jgi:glycosyltransferase involved in cell wall biosynthesis